ncbi:DNA polymerase III subunit delta' [Litorimonas cladophorae]|uniref:DNA polymerase III subunit delta n=2 Tax=Litorimonas cladophorae TaxID=1220491 RepID=A0A918NCY1_9PROT|nr:DNA polymerase III subunit delta' [Litorimonas cladophorae]
MHHAWLLSGPKGIGKATLAYRMARKLLGGESLLSSSLDIPESDAIAQRVEALTHGNLFVLRRPYDTKLKRFRQDIPVDRVREVSGFFQETAAETGTWRVCIIDSADELNRNSENAILKLLEEPPSNTLFILISSAPGRLLPTIRSRCMALELRAVPDNQILSWLSDQGSGSSDLLKAAVKLSRGAPGKALALVQNADVVLRSISDYLNSLGAPALGVDMTIAKRMAEKRHQISRGLFWDSLDDTIHAHALFAATGQYEGPFAPAKVNRSAKAWQENHARLRDVRRAEEAINLDKTATMFELLSSIRAA